MSFVEYGMILYFLCSVLFITWLPYSCQFTKSNVIVGSIFGSDAVLVGYGADRTDLALKEPKRFNSILGAVGSLTRPSIS